MDCGHDVGVSVEELQEVLQAPEKAFAAAQNRLCELVVELFEFLIDVLENQSNNTTNCENQRAKGECAEMESNCPVDASCQREKRNVLLPHCPIPASECSRQNHFGECGDEENQPEKSHDIDGLESGHKWRCHHSLVSARCNDTRTTVLDVTKVIKGSRHAHVAILDVSVISSADAASCCFGHSRDFVLVSSDRSEIEEHEDGDEDHDCLEDPWENWEEHSCEI